jgi:AcrR family transcriptional regulator
MKELRSSVNTSYINDYSFILPHAMPRKRTIPDEALLDAALGLLREVGPDAVSFGSLASRVDLAPSTLVQRFGSKAALLQAALLRAWAQLEVATDEAIAAAPDGTGGVVELLVSLTGQYDAHDFADQLRVLREDLRDPVLRERGEAWFAAVSEAVGARLAGARGGDDDLGRLVVATWQGTLTVWSFTRDAPVVDVVRHTLEELLGRLIPEERRRRSPARRPGSEA